LLFTVFVVLAILVGGIAELVPTLTIDKAVPLGAKVQTPYTPLELHGRDIYVREGCYTCHSQMVRPFVSETLRYRGGPSTPGDSIYDHPFQWGSKRTGPDLAHVGVRIPAALWHYQHFMDPPEISENSIMPAYAFLADARLDVGDTVLKLKAMKTLGVPYSNVEIAHGEALVKQQAQRISQDLANQGVALPWDSEMTALIAYVQCLGTKSKAPETGPGGAVAAAPAAAAPGAPAAAAPAAAAPGAPAAAAPGAPAAAAPGAPAAAAPAAAAPAAPAAAAPGAPAPAAPGAPAAAAPGAPAAAAPAAPAAAAPAAAAPAAPAATR
jgi:cytochrome c oxidase cbb3-type subunit I/II